MVTEAHIQAFVQSANDRSIAQPDLAKGEVNFIMTQESIDILRFLSELLQSFVDSYLFVALAIKQLQASGKAM